MSLVKLAGLVCMSLAAVIAAGCLLFASGLVLQGVARLEGEVLAKAPETATELAARLRIVLSLICIGMGSSVVVLTGLASSGVWKGTLRSRVRKAGFVGFVFWAGFCSFFCLLILTGSLQSRWELPREYIWLSGGAGALGMLSIGLAGVFAERKPGEPVSPKKTP